MFRVVPYSRGPGWEVDIRIRLANGRKHRDRRIVTHRSKTAAIRWAEDRERHLLQHGPKAPAAPPPKEVPTIEAFVPRFVDGHARANRLKPSSIASMESILKWHVVPMFGSLPLDALTNEAVQQLKLELVERTPKTVNNVLTCLRTLLKKAVEWGELEELPCTISFLKNPRQEMAFFGFDEYERVVEAARRQGPDVALMIMFGGDAGLRLGEIVAVEWGDLDLTARRLTVQRSDWRGKVTAPKGGRLRYVPLTSRLAGSLKARRHLRSERVLCQADGSPVTRDIVIKAIRRSERAAGVRRAGVHILRHTFCSHLAMRGAAARAIQELAGHSSLTTTQRYMHLSPGATEDAIRLLEHRGEEWGRRDEKLG